MRNKITTHANNPSIRLCRKYARQFEDFDEATNRIIQKHGFASNKYISVLKSKSLYIRNDFMVDLGRKHAIDTGCDLYVQVCGLFHGIGGHNKFFSYPYAQSLMGLYQEQGCSVLTILPTDNELTSLSFPADCPATLGKDLCIATLPIMQEGEDEGTHINGLLADSRSRRTIFGEALDASKRYQNIWYILSDHVAEAILRGERVVISPETLEACRRGEDLHLQPMLL